VDPEFCFLDGAVCNLNQKDKFQAIHELIQSSPVFYNFSKLQEFEQEVIGRENKQSTGIGHGVAVAHGCSDEARSVLISLGISKQGIDYDAIDGKPVFLLFLIATPPVCHEEYLITLSVLVKLIRRRAFRRRLLGASSVKDAELVLHDAFCEQAKMENNATFSKECEDHE
jgi:PTS system nitrogen regulatory IIA component